MKRYLITTIIIILIFNLCLNCLSQNNQNVENLFINNNKISKPISNSEIIFEDDMENNENSWIHFDSTEVIEGNWKISDSGYNSYLWCVIDELNSNYDNNWNDVALINKSFNFSLYKNITLIFDINYKINDNDYGYVEISNDYGRHWEIIEYYTGELNWTNKIFNLTYLNDYHKCNIRYRFYSNESITNRGMLIDDIKIIGDNYIIFYDDFETNAEKWIIERLRPGDWWQRIRKEKDGNLNNKAWWCGDEFKDKYCSNMNNVLELKKSINLTNIFKIEILFSTWLNFSDMDTGYFEISNDKGKTWDILEEFIGRSLNDNTQGWVNKSYEINDWMKGEIKIRFRFVSDSNNESKGWYIDDIKIFGYIDNDPPITACILSGDIGQNNWYISTVEVSLVSTDGDGSGVENIYYKLDDEEKISYNIPFIINQNGWHTIEYWSIDKQNNIENHKYEKLKIDTDNPEIDIIKPEICTYLGNKRIWPIFRSNFLFISKPLIFGDIEIKVDASDSMSGVNRVEFFIDNEIKNSDFIIPYEWMWSEKKLSVMHDINVVVYDVAGNNINEQISVIKIF